MQQQFTNSPTNKLKPTLCHPPYWFHAVNRLENGLLGLIRTGLGLTNGVKKTGKSETGFSSVWQMDYALINKRKITVIAYYIQNTINRQKEHARYLQARKLTQPVIGDIKI